MKEHPILFNGEMVRAILAGRKTQTRRVIKWDKIPYGYDLTDPESMLAQNPGLFGVPGDHLWVRETWYNDTGHLSGPEAELYYRADGECCEQIPECACAEMGKPKWIPNIHMFRWASRINLKVTGVRVERVQEIDEAGIKAEGVVIPSPFVGCVNGEPQEIATAHWDPWDYFKDLWDSINDKRGFGWESNPWVWVVEFERSA